MGFSSGTIIDQSIRDDIMKDDGNVLVSASAGSGKTTTIVKKINQILLGEIENHKSIAALTFTNKATQEIKSKGKFSQEQVIISNNDSFIEYEIIRNFILDTPCFHGSEASNFIIEYGREFQFSEFEDGIRQLKEQKILGSFVSKKENFKFKLACYILQSSIAAQQYLKAKYQVFFIDEYQDSDQDMHDFFMFLKNTLGLKLFIVGDTKQAIYKWRGAMDNIFELLKAEQFNYYKLVHNFRCHSDIQNYANFIHDYNEFKSSNKEIENVIFSREQDIVSNFQNLLNEGVLDINKEITIISNINDKAKCIADELNSAGYKFVFVPKTPIEEGLANGHFLKSLAYFSKNDRYSVYDFLNDIQFGDDSRKVVKEIGDMIQILKLHYILDSDDIVQVLKNVSSYLSIGLSDEEIIRFVETILNSYYQNSFSLDYTKYNVMTVFSSKGLEFDQVIGFSSEYRIGNMRSSNNDIEKHYVCITRAKEKFIMILDEDNYLKVIETRMRNHQVKNIFKLI